MRVCGMWPISRLPFVKIAAVVAPVTMTVVLVFALFGRSVLEFVPATDDEIFYWRQAWTFSEVGFAGGYYTFDEHPAAWTASRFGAHGPAYPILYGTVGRLVGWEPYSAILVNFVLQSLALAVLIRMARPNSKQLLAIVAVCLTFWPLQWELLSNMQEVLHLAFACVLAAVMNRLFRPQAQPLLPQQLVLVLGLVAGASLLRPFWILLVPPILLLNQRQPTPRRVLGIIVLSAAVVAATILVVIYISAPYPNFLRNLLDAIADSPRSGMRLVIEKLAYAIPHFFEFTPYNALYDTSRYQLAILAGLATGLAVSSLWQARERVRRRASSWGLDLQSAFHTYNLVGITAIVIVLYIPTGYQGFRVYAPYLLLTLLLLVLSNRYRLVGLWVALSLLTTPIFLTSYAKEKARNFGYDAAAVEAFRGAVRPYLDFEPGGSAWGNTLLLDLPLLCGAVRCDYLTTVPAGIGISVIAFPERLQVPLKSKYLLLSDEGYLNLNAQLGPTLHLVSLGGTPFGTLYLNLDAESTP